MECNVYVFSNNYPIFFIFCNLWDSTDRESGTDVCLSFLPVAKQDNWLLTLTYIEQMLENTSQYRKAELLSVMFDSHGTEQA